MHKERKPRWSRAEKRRATAELLRERAELRSQVLSILRTWEAYVSFGGFHDRFKTIQSQMLIHKPDCFYAMKVVIHAWEVRLGGRNPSTPPSISECDCLRRG